MKKLCAMSSGCATSDSNDQKELDIRYKEYVIPRQYRPDLWVEEKVIVENKATAVLTEIDELRF